MMDFYTSPYDLEMENPRIAAMVLFFLTAMITAVSCSAMVFVRRTGPRHRVLLSCALASSLLFAVGLGLAIQVVHEARQALLDPDITNRGGNWYDSLDHIEPVLSFVALAMGGFSVLGVLTLVLVVRRAPEIRAHIPLGLSFTCLLLFIITALGIGLRLSFIGSAPPLAAQLMEPTIQWAIDHGDLVLNIARWSILIIAISMTLVYLIQAFRNRSIAHFSNGSVPWILGVLVAAIGGHAWLVTRPLAFDARAPLPQPRGGPVSLCPELLHDAARLPRATGEDLPEDRPCYDHYVHVGWFGLLELRSSGAMLNGESLTAPDELERMLEKRFDVKSQARDRHVVIAADAAMQAIEFSPWLAAIPKRALVTFLLVHDNPSHPTHTAGVVARRARCDCTMVELSSGGKSLAGYTWADAARAPIRSWNPIPTSK